MLRNSFLSKYEPRKTKYSLNEEHLIKESEEYLVFKNRPLAPKSITKLSKKHLVSFVDGVLTNQKVSSTLYSSNSTSEIGRYVHSNEVMERNSSSPCRYSRLQTSQAPSASRMKEYRSQYSKIKEHIRNYQKSKVTRVTLLKKKNNLFFSNLKKQNKTVKKESSYESLNTLRLKNYNRSLQRCRSQIAKNPFFELPDVKLEINNVFSRLYHNEVLIIRSKTETLKFANKKITSREVTSNSTTWANNHTHDTEKEPIAFNLKQVIKKSNGREFTMKVTDRVFNRCFYKHSGGPMSRSMPFYLKRQEEFREDNEDLISLTRIKDEKGNSYLHDAVMDESYDFVKYYLGKGLSPNEQNSSGNTPLHLAMKVRIPEIINLLLDNKGDLTIENLKKETPYDLAPIELKKHLKLDKKLIDKITFNSSLSEYNV